MQYHPPSVSEKRETLNRLLTLGLTKAKHGDIHAATAIFQEISSIQFQHTSDYLRAGTLASYIGQHGHAVKLVKTATVMAPDSHEVWAAFGNIYCNSGYPEQGLEAYRRAMDINPDLVLPALAQAYDVLGMQDQADAELARIARRRFGNAHDKKRHDMPSLFFAFLPKSAGTSICHAIEECTGITLGDAVAITDSEHFPNSRISREALSISIQHAVQLHTHVRADDRNLKILDEAGIRQIHVHVRDPRQAFVSYFFHSKSAMGLARNRHANPEFDKLDDQRRFRWFIDFYYPKFIDWIMGWAQIEKNLAEHPFSLKITTFEDMLQTGQSGLVRDICESYGITPNRMMSETKHRFRKGLVDEWKSIIPVTYHTTLSNLIPPDLAERFGWEL